MSPPSHVRMWRTYAHKQNFLLSERPSCMHCLLTVTVKGNGVSHTHCYICDKILMHSPTTQDFDLASNASFSDLWVRGKIFKDGNDKIYNHRIFCYVCASHHRYTPFATAAELGYDENTSLAVCEKIHDDEGAIDIYYGKYTDERFEEEMVANDVDNDIFVEVRRHRSCDIL
jgi:hypothetical protein